MKISFEYFAQVRKAAGVEKEALELADGTDLLAALALAAEKHGAEFRALLHDDTGAVRASIIVLVNGAATRRDQPRGLSDGDSISLLSAVAGG